MIRTVRAKFTALTMSVLAIVVVGLGVGIDLLGGRLMLAQIDAELRSRGDGMAARHLAMDRDPGGRPREGPGGPGRGGLGLGGPGRPAGALPFDRPPNDPLRAIGPRVIPVQPLPGPAIDDRPGFSPPSPFDLAAFDLAKKGSPSLSTVLVEGEPVRVYSVLAPARDQRFNAVIQVPYPLKDHLQARQNLRDFLLWFIPIVLLPAGLASLFLVSRLMAPIRTIDERASRIGASELHLRLPVVGQDEFAGLSRTINLMLDRLRDSFGAQKTALEHVERVLNEQRRFTADASHELKTPLATIKANTALLRDAKGITRSELVEAVDSAVDRMSRLVNALLLLSRAEAGVQVSRMERTDLRALVETVIPVLPGAKERVQLETDGSLLPVEMHLDMVERAVLNLVDNALRHSGSEGVLVSIGREGSDAVVRVRDQGCGIPPEHLPHLFERFYRVDASRTAGTGGTGLGLAIVKAVAEAHGGSVEVQSTSGEGSTFTLRLPLA